jgi:uncharacterized membrane protein
MGAEMRGKIISRDFVIGILLFVVCLVTYFIIIPRQVGGELQRGLPPDFFPKFAVAFVGIFSAFLVFKDLLTKTEDAGPDETPVRKRQGRKGLILALIASLIYLILCTLIGYIISTIVMLAAFMWIFGERRWGTLVGVPLVTVAVIYLFFAKVMEVGFPLGMFFE